MKGKIHSIETMGMVDGPGIRTVIFLQGCPLRCLYCHNPDTQDIGGGKIMSAEELVELARRYLPYYKRSGGGVTFSGGEPLMQSGFLLEALELFKKEGVCTVLDTSGFGQKKYMEKIVESVSYVIMDIKHYDDKAHSKLTGSTTNGRDYFLQLVKKHRKRTLIRHVMLPGYTDSIDAMEKLYDSIRQLSSIVEKIEILPYHKHGLDKYRELEIDYQLKDLPEMDHKLAASLERYINDLHLCDRSRELAMEA